MCDVTKKEDIAALYERIAAKEDRLDVLVANAGIPGPKADPAGENDGNKLKERLWPNESVEDWDEVHRADVTSIYCESVLSALACMAPMLSALCKCSHHRRILAFASKVKRDYAHECGSHHHYLHVRSHPARAGPLRLQ